MAPRAIAKLPPAAEVHPADPARTAAPRALDGLRLIALFKFAKALLLIATDYGVHLLLNEDLLERLRLWTASLTDSYAQRMLLRAIGWLADLGATRIHVVLGITLGYTVVVLAEGIGLWMRRTWAEWFTVTATASLIPFELWELVVRPPGRKLMVGVTVVLNLLVVGYLLRLLRHPASTGSAGGTVSAARR